MLICIILTQQIIIMMHLKICPICSQSLPPIQPDKCPHCEFDFHTYQLMCRSCNKYFPMEKTNCPYCSHPAPIIRYSPTDIEYSAKAAGYRKIFLFSALTDNVFLLSYILTFNRNPLEILIIMLFLFSILKALLYYPFSKSPLLVFTAAFLLSILPLFFVVEAAVYSIDFLIFFIPYIIILIIISLGYNASWKIKNSEIIEKCF